MVLVFAIFYKIFKSDNESDYRLPYLRKEKKKRKKN